MMDELILAVELLGTVAFASAGAVTGLKKQADLLGVILLGVITSTGGGILRDIILGTSNSGLYIAEKNGGYTALDTYDGLSSRKIMRIKKDHKRDIYWIITGNSIA